jgi:hypothetical protein
LAGLLIEKYWDLSKPFLTFSLLVTCIDYWQEKRHLNEFQSGPNRWKLK